MLPLPSFDTETEIDHEFDLNGISIEDIEKAAKTLTGDSQQIPPSYSAKKLAGRKAYDLARKGEMVHLPAASITIHHFELTDISMPNLTFRIHCSKGTYIRAVARDLGYALGNGAHLNVLRRKRVGDYSVKHAFTLECLDEQLRSGKLIPS